MIVLVLGYHHDTCEVSMTEYLAIFGMLKQVA
jgi:hypothetical protein